VTTPFFTSNDLDIVQLEGLYIRERNPPAIVKGVVLNGIGFVGECVRGPVDKVVEITSEARFKEVFGGRDKTANGTGGTLLGKVWQSLLNKPFGKLYVVRAAAAAAVKASFDWETAAGGAGTAVLRIAAANVGTWGNDVMFKVANATDGVANHFNLTIRYLGNDIEYKNLSVDTGEDNLASKVGTNDGRLIDLTKLASGRPVNTSAGVDGADSSGFVNLGETVASFVSVAGTDGSIADTDFTGTGKGLELLSNYKGVAVLAVAERMSATIKAKVLTLSATAVDRMYLIGPDSETVTVSSAKTDAATYRSDRIIYCYNHSYTQDPDVGTELLVRPEPWMASILSQVDVDIHPGEEDTKKYTAGIIRLYNEALARQDYIDLKAAGICAMEKDEGFAFVSGVTTSLTSGKTEITRRRMTDYIQLSLAAELKFSVKKKNTQTRRLANAAMIKSFLNQLKKEERIVDSFSVDTEKLNTDISRAQGIEKILLRVKLLGHILHLVLETEIGTSVTITELV